MRALNLAFAAACLFGLAQAASLIFLHVPLDPNEGWNAYHAAAAMAGAPLYPHGLFFDNYPPLSFYVVGMFGGDHIVAGRIVSLLSLLAVAAAIYACLRRMDTTRTAALFAALWFVAGMLVFSDYVAMDDPQLLGHAVAMLGLVLLLRGNVVGAALAMTAALFVKHNLVALPLATLAWLALADRRDALRFAATGIAAGAAGLLLFRLVYGVSLLGQLTSPRLFSFALLEGGIGHWWAWGGMAMAVTVPLAFLARDRKDAALVGLYVLAAIVSGAVFSGGAGVDANAWFDAAIACALGMGLSLELAASAQRRWVAPVVSGLVVLQLLAGALGRDDWPSRQDAADRDIAFLKAQPGPALCEMLSLCYWAGKPEAVDVFNLGQAYATHAQSDDALVALIAARQFGAVEFDSFDDFTLTPRVKTALLANYRIDHAGDTGVFLVRRSRP